MFSLSTNNKSNHLVILLFFIFPLTLYILGKKINISLFPLLALLMFTLCCSSYFDGLRIIYSFIWLYLLLLFRFFIYDYISFKIIFFLYVCALLLYIFITFQYTYEIWREYYLFVNHSTNSLHNLTFSFATILCLQRNSSKKYRIFLF